MSKNKITETIIKHAKQNKSKKKKKQRSNSAFREYSKIPDELVAISLHNKV